jgi:Bacterial SH3 domain
MSRTFVKIFFPLVFLLGLALSLKVEAVLADPVAQVPTGSIPTVTGTPVEAIIIVQSNAEQDQVNVRSGPGTIGYDIVGVLAVGEQVPAIGQSPGGEWVEIVYPGVPDGVAWVYRPLVEVRGSLPIVEPPPTPTPRVTPTIDPTLAAQFLVQVPPTRLPTFTPPPPLRIPTFTSGSTGGVAGRLPMGFVIIGMAVLGIFGLLISFLRGR